MKSSYISKSLLFLCLLSCKQPKHTEKNDAARDLFIKSADLISDITAKIKNASDSIEVDSLSNLFEKNITDINFDYPPQTDLNLNEIENDSLFKLLEIMKAEKDTKLQQLSNVITDTVSKDIHTTSF